MKTQNKKFSEVILSLGRFFFRHRGIVAIPPFILLVYFSNPVQKTTLSHILIITGIIIRLWASGYIGKDGRGREIKGESKIRVGPFKILRHPLYIGNFFLVTGTILLYNPPGWLKFIFISTFLVEYSLIIFTEEEYLKKLPEKSTSFSIEKMKYELSTIVIIVIIYIIYFLLQFRFP